VYVCVFAGDIYVQEGGGTNDFLPLNQTWRYWSGITVTPGGDVYACEYNGDIYQMDSSGIFELLGQTSRRWTGMVSLSNGNVYACVTNGDIYKQTGGVGDFEPLGQTSRRWRGMAVDSNDNVYACDYGFNVLDTYGGDGDIYKQTEGSGDFVALELDPQKWMGIAITPDDAIYASTYISFWDVMMDSSGDSSGNFDPYLIKGDIYKKHISLMSFFSHGQTLRNWRSMCVAPNGDLYACVFGYIYDSNDFEVPYYDYEYDSGDSGFDDTGADPDDFRIGYMDHLDENVLCDIDIGEVKECVEVLEDSIKWEYFPVEDSSS
jgi:hypothetical protein